MRAFAVIALIGLTLAACGERVETAAPTEKAPTANATSDVDAIPPTRESSPRREVMFEGGAYEHQVLADGERVPGLPDLGGAYSGVRTRLIAAGFQPLVATPAGEEPYSVCPEEFEGGEYMDKCPSAPIVLPEVEACAGSGLAPCRLRWRAPDGRSLIIVTTGEPQPGGVSGIEWGSNP